MFQAALQGNIKLVQKLLEYKAYPHIVGNYDISPLHIATQHGRYKIAELLLQNNADANQHGYGWQSYTPLHNTAIYGHCRIVEILLKYNADPNRKSHFKETPLDLATCNNHDAVVALLKATEL